MFKKFLLFIIALSISTASIAEEFRAMLPWGVGQASDTIARTIAQVFHENTGDTLIIENMPGGQTITGTIHYKNDPRIQVYITTSTSLGYNPVVLTPPLPYTDADFNNIIWVATQSGVWVTRHDTGIKTTQDLLARMPKFVAGNSPTMDLNTISLAKEKNLKVEIVPYKTGSELVQALLSNSVDLVVAGNSSSIMSLVKDGKLHIIGTTLKDDVVIDGIKMPSIPKRTGVAGVNAFIGIALKPSLDQDKANYLKKELYRAVTSPKVKNVLESLGFLTDSTDDQKQVMKNIMDYRALLKKYLAYK